MKKWPCMLKKSLKWRNNLWRRSENCKQIWKISKQKKVESYLNNLLKLLALISNSNKYRSTKLIRSNKRVNFRDHIWKSRKIRWCRNLEHQRLRLSKCRWRYELLKKEPFWISRLSNLGKITSKSCKIWKNLMNSTTKEKCRESKRRTNSNYRDRLTIMSNACKK